MTDVSVLRSRIHFARSCDGARSRARRQLHERRLRIAVEIGSLTSGATSAVLSLASDWTRGYCANVTIGNSGSTATTTWQVVIT